MEDKIKKVIDWMPVMEIPTCKSKKYDELGGEMCGVYQFAIDKDIKEIGDAIIHEKIGYNGRSDNILGRTYGMRTKKGKHGARHYCDQNDVDRNTVYVRYLLTESTEDAQALEKYIHKQTEETVSHGYKYAWIEASGGLDGATTYILSLISELSSIDIQNVVIEARQMGIDKYTEEMHYDTI